MNDHRLPVIGLICASFVSFVLLCRVGLELLLRRMLDRTFNEH